MTREWCDGVQRVHHSQHLMERENLLVAAIEVLAASLGTVRCLLIARFGRHGCGGYSSASLRKPVSVLLQLVWVSADASLHAGLYTGRYDVPCIYIARVELPTAIH